jgi:DNA-binding FadR family transcriptional regulator
MNWRHIRRAMGATLQSAATRDAVWDEHEAISKAIARGNAQQAEQLMGRHGEAAREHLLRRLSEMRSGGDAAKHSGAKF